MRVVSNARYISKIYSYREIGSRRYNYEEMNMPRNLIIGDAIASLNHIYAMTIAALKVIDKIKLLLCLELLN